MKARLVRIGNSRGVRLPRLLIEEARLPEEVELLVRDGTIVITPAKGVREGWSEAAQQLHERGEDEPIGTNQVSRFDEEDWRW